MEDQFSGLFSIFFYHVLLYQHTTWSWVWLVPTSWVCRIVVFQNTPPPPKFSCYVMQSNWTAWYLYRFHDFSMRPLLSVCMVSFEAHSMFKSLSLCCTLVYFLFCNQSVEFYILFILFWHFCVSHQIYY